MAWGYCSDVFGFNLYFAGLNLNLHCWHANTGIRE